MSRISSFKTKDNIVESFRNLKKVEDFSRTIILRGLFVKFVEFGHKIFNMYINLSFFDISQVDIKELASRG